MTNHPAPSPQVQGPIELLAQIRALPQYVAGKTAPVAGAIKLSSNESPYPPHPRVVEAISRAGAEAHRYPDIYGQPLREALARSLGDAASFPLCPEHLVVGNGSVALLQHALGVVCGPGGKVVLPWRSFEAYPIIIGGLGAQALPVALDSEYRHDLPAMAEACRDRAVRAVLLCSPNNPTGPALSHRSVVEFLDRTLELNPSILVLLDQAYSHFVTDPGAVRGLELLGKYPNLAVLGTFSKAYQLAGMRVGYLASSNLELTGYIRAYSTPFGLNAAGQAAALAALQVESELKAQITQIIAERERVLAQLRQAGWRIPAAEGNFFFLPYPDHLERIVAALAAHKITARPFPEGLRISIGSPQENQALLAALGEVQPPA